MVKLTTTRLCKRMKNPLRYIILTLILVLSACGGGGGGGGSTTPPPVTNNLPNAVNDNYSIDQDTSLSADVSSNDTGLQDAPVTYSVATAATSGGLSLSSDGSFLYTPEPGFTGNVTFTYRVTDNNGDSDTATVTITVNEVIVDNQPVANDDSFTTSQGQPVFGNVSSNDSGLQDAPVTYQLADQPSSGTLSFNPDGRFTYTPQTDFVGTISFTYTVTDNDGDSDSATVRITVVPAASSDWEPLNPEVNVDVESQVQNLLSQMTTEEKVGQLIMAEIQNVSAADVRNYNLGAVLNGGGSWPDNNDRATAADWVALADSYYQASVDTSDGGVGIPIIWGTDAVHGHNNVYGATMFPHNIGLGAANNPSLMRDIGRLTALQVRATGIDWNFAPTVATVRDDRWGRTYEGYSEEQYYSYTLPIINRHFTSAGKQV